jgi:hypothetical protein
MARIENTNLPRGARQMLGHDLDWWNTAMLFSLAAAALAALSLAVSTTIVVKLQRQQLLPRQEVLAGHETDITEKLKPFAGTKFDSGLNPISAEQSGFWEALEPVLVASDWVHLKWSDGHTIPLWIFSAGKPSQKNLPVSAPVAVTNVEIHLPPEHREKFEPAVTALVSALNDIGIVATDAGADAISINKDAIHIWIGEKK